MKFSKNKKKSFLAVSIKSIKYGIVFSANKHSFSSSFLSESLYSQDLEHYPEEMWRGWEVGLSDTVLLCSGMSYPVLVSLRCLSGQQIELHKCLFCI